VIHEVKGDILLSHAQVIAHAIAPYEHFDRGLALSLREQWPALMKDYHHFYHAMHPQLGETWVWSGAMSKHIINLLVNEPPRKGEKGESAAARSLKMSIAHCASYAGYWKASGLPAWPCRAWRRVPEVWIGVRCGR
jgi:O-acetyl-ADP-ribose deacetylase (regulator of RNase III)